MAFQQLANIFVEWTFGGRYERLIAKKETINLALMWLIDISHGKKLMNSACLHCAKYEANLHPAISRHFTFTWLRSEDETKNFLLSRWTGRR